MEISAKPHWSHWVISVLGALWSLGGCFDYLMTQTENAAYFEKVPKEMVEYWYAMPTWIGALWALAVWGGLLGWVFMLLRRRWAVPVFIVSLVSLLINFSYTFATGGMALQAKHMGAGSAYGFTAMIILFAIFAVWYARRARNKGILR